MSAAANVSGQVGLTLNFQQIKTSGVLGQSGQSKLTEILSISDQLGNGTGAALTADQLYAAQLTLSAAATTIHFETATVDDPFGGTLAMLRIRGIAVQNVTITSGYDVKVEAAASNGISWLPPSTSPLLARANGGTVFIYDPNSNGAGVGNVVGATTDGLTLDPGSNTCTVNIIVFGDSVA